MVGELFASAVLLLASVGAFVVKLSKESEAVQASGDSSEGVPSGVSHTADTVTAADTSSIADALTTPEVVSVADALSTAAEVFSAFV